jgi:cyclopropane fatty-acyl-phospholipid synthase-like methyltransferase
MENHTALYLAVREKEGRLYTDELVRRLPEIPPDHRMRAEWHARARSSQRLTAYLSRLEKGTAILELGCGNGWLSHGIAKATSAEIVGMDRDSPELRQARRVFASQENLGWVVADIFSSPFSHGAFDVIVIASAIQYFADLARLVETLSPLLTARGEIHILDSPLYSIDALPAARQRSRQYYESLGFPEMAADYHHHSVEVLRAYRPTWLYSPPSPPPTNDSPFPWLSLRPECPR